MKNFVLSSIMVLFSLSSFANEPADQKKDDLTTKAFELLVKNQDKIKLIGNVAPKEKLKPILDDLGKYIVENMFAVLDGDDQDYKGHIINFNADCKEPAAQSLSTECTLIIEYKPMGDTAIVFQVGLDKDKNPVSILRNKAEVLRGS